MGVINAFQGQEMDSSSVDESVAFLVKNMRLAYDDVPAAIVISNQIGEIQVRHYRTIQLYLFGINGAGQGFNKSAEDLFGYSARDVLGKNISTLMPANYATVRIYTC